MANSSGQGVLNLGYGNYVAVAHVVVILNASSAPIKRLREEARDHNKLIDATQGRRTRSVVVTDGDQLILSALVPDTLAQRYLDAQVRRHENTEETS